MQLYRLFSLSTFFFCCGLFHWILLFISRSLAAYSTSALFSFRTSGLISVTLSSLDLVCGPGNARTNSASSFVVLILVFGRNWREETGGFTFCRYPFIFDTSIKAEYLRVIYASCFLLLSFFFS